MQCSRHVRLAMGRLTKSLSKKSCMLLSTSKHFIFNQQFSKKIKRSVEQMQRISISNGQMD